MLTPSNQSSRENDYSSYLPAAAAANPSSLSASQVDRGRRKFSLNNCISINYWSLRTSALQTKETSVLQLAWNSLLNTTVTFPSSKDDLERFRVDFDNFIFTIEQQHTTYEEFLTFCLLQCENKNTTPDVLEKVGLLILHLERGLASEETLAKFMMMQGSLHPQTLAFLKTSIKAYIALFTDKDTLFRQTNNVTKLMVMWFKAHFYEWNKKIFNNDFIQYIEHSDEPPFSLALSLLQSIHKEFTPIRFREGDLFDIMNDIKRSYETYYEKRIPVTLLYGTIFFLRVINLTIMEPHKWGFQPYSGAFNPPQRARDLIHLLQYHSNGKALNIDVTDELKSLLNNERDAIITLMMDKLN